MTRVIGILAAILLATVPAVADTVSGVADCKGSCDNYVVYLEGGPRIALTGAKAVVLDQKDRMFVPRVLPVFKGTTVNITNSDAFLHNVHMYQGKETVLNLALPFQGQVIPHVFEETGTYSILCDAHSEMSAFIIVLETPHFTTPDESGAYQMAEVPAGNYTLVVRNLKTDWVATSELTVN